MPSKPSTGKSVFSLEDLERFSKSTPNQTATTTSLTPRMRGVGKLDKKTPEGSSPLATKTRGVLEQYQEILGGRENVVDALNMAALDKKQQHFLRLLCDPARAQDSLIVIAQDCGMKPSEALDMFRSAAFAKSHALAMGKLAESLSPVVEDIIAKSVDAEVMCSECFGEQVAGFVCETCHGRGTMMRESTIDHQKLVLEATGVTKKSSGVNVQVNQQVGVVSSGSFFSKVVRATDETAYDVGQIEEGEVMKVDGD